MESFDGLFESATLVAAAELLMKLGLGVLVGGAIGWERETHGHPAGVRTHMLLCLGVVLFSEVSKSFGGDPGRIAAQIFTGVGFLGAGAILRTGLEIRGLTTAASLWAVAGISMAVSAGHQFYWVAIASTFLALFTLSVVDNFERRFAPQAQGFECRVVLPDAASLARCLEEIERTGSGIREMRLTRLGESRLEVTFRVTGGRRPQVLQAIESCQAESVEIV